MTGVLPRRQTFRHDLTLFPSTRLGWWTVLVAALAVAWALLFPAVQSPLAERVNDTPFRWLSGGGEMLMVAVAFGIVAAVLGLWTLFRRHDRAVLVWLAVVPSLLASAFWILFAAGELLSPH